MPRTTHAAPTAESVAESVAESGAETEAGPAAGPSTAPPAHPVPRPRRLRTAPAAPLGSLTQLGRSEPEPCPVCGGTRMTTLTLTLTDGTPVRFTSCRRCEHRRWEAGDGELSIGAVLDRTRRTP